MLSPHAESRSLGSLTGPDSAHWEPRQILSLPRIQVLPLKHLDGSSGLHISESPGKLIDHNRCLSPLAC